MVVTEPKLSLLGIVYLHDISGIRYTASEETTFDICRSLCGPQAMTGIIIGTTKWPNPTDHDPKTRNRQQEFHDKHWTDVSSVVPLHEFDTEAPRQIISQLLKNPQRTLVVEEELISSRLKPNLDFLDRTSIGKHVRSKFPGELQRKFSIKACFSNKEITEVARLIPEILFPFPKGLVTLFVLLMGFCKRHFRW